MNNIVICRIVYFKAVVNLPQHCSKGTISSRFKNKISNENIVNVWMSDLAGQSQAVL